MSAALVVQKALRACLVDSPAVMDLVPASSILDVNERPAPRPSVILGEADEVLRGRDLAHGMSLVTHTLHIWTQEESTEACKTIIAAVRAAIDNADLDLSPDHYVIDHGAAMVRVMRDPDGATAHGVLTVEVLAKEEGSC